MHSCPNCGQACYCNGDIDDIEVDTSAADNCSHCDDYDDGDDAGDDWCEECNNMGIITCHCGGDLCVCENHGEMPCPKCGD